VTRISGYRTAACTVDCSPTKTLLDSDGETYSLLEPGPSVPVGERLRLKGHQSGSSPARSFQIEKILRDYGPCQP